MEVSRLTFFSFDCGLRSRPARSVVRVNTCSEVMEVGQMVEVVVVLGWGGVEQRMGNE